jgi:hypothetical protein
MPLTINQFGEMCRVLIYLRPLAESVLTAPVILKLPISQWYYICILCVELVSNCVENSRETGQIFYLRHYMKYPSHSADLHANQNS